MRSEADPIKVKDILYAMIAESEYVIMSIINPLFIGRDIGSSGLAAYEVIATVFLLLYAIIRSVTTGVEAICAKDVGIGNHDSFQKHKNAAYSWTILLCVIFALLLILFSGEIAEFLAEDGGELLCSYVADGINAVALVAVPLAFFAIANCMLYFEEKRQLLYLDIIYYGMLILASVYVSRTQPSIWGYIMADTVAFVAADIYIAGYFVLKRRKSKAVYSSVNLRFRDIRD